MARHDLLDVERVARIDDRQVRHAAEHRDVLGRLVARPVAGGQARQGAADLDVEVLLGDRLADEVVGAAGGEHGVGGGERACKPFVRHAGRRPPSAAARPCPSGRSGRDRPCAKMCRSVYLPRSAVRPTISGRVSASCDQRLAERGRLGALALAGERGDHRRGGQARLVALLAAVALLGEPRRAACTSSVSWLLPASSICQRLLPFVRFDAQEVVLLALLEERHALAHPGVADDHARLRLGRGRAPCRRPPPRASMSLPSTRCDVPAEAPRTSAPAARSSGPRSRGRRPAGC